MDDTQNNTDEKQSVIIEGTCVEGTISGSEAVRVEGTIKGEVDLENMITIAPTGSSNSEIKAKNVFIEGEHAGNITASEYIQISPEGRVKAELKAPAISIEKGAKFSGKIEMFGDEN